MSNYNPGLNMPAAHGSVDISYLQRTSPGPPPPLNLPQVSTPAYPSVALQPSPILSSHPPSPLPYPALSAMPQADTTLSIHPRTSATFTFVPTLPEDKNKLDRDASLANDYILNSHIVDDADFARFVVRSDKKQTKVFHSNAAENQSPIVTLEFGRAFSSPQMSIGNGTRIKCKEWVPLWPKDHTRRILQHGGRNYVWYPRGDVNVNPKTAPAFRSRFALATPQPMNSRWRYSQKDSLPTFSRPSSLPWSS
ncbi:hypothetical protein OF83DRAFT_1102142 [Amylostereum chailletii]|nr:hypothetical protein OF83DRAFT_1102142 [Amylostereum chailletii]